MEGASIGQYRVLRKLGEGGMGAVWLAEHTLLGRRAAIKMILPVYSASQTILQRFFNEAKAVTAIADPGIVQVFDFGLHTDGSAFLVMELLEGEAMDARLRRIGRFSPLDALRLMRQIATSLSAAHAKGVIHRDLKPENIFIVGDPAVTGGERPKILDFGIAKLAGDDPGKIKTRTGVLMGTPVYMSPEQCRGASSVDHRSDVYALGCVLFTMLVGRPPFEAEGSGDIIIAHVRDQPPVPSSLAPGLPPVIDALVLRCLEKDAGARFQSMGELVQAIGATESAIYGYPVDGYRAAPQLPAPYPGMITPRPPTGHPTPVPAGGSAPTTPGYPGASYPGAPTPRPGASYPGAPTPAPAAANAVTTLGSSLGEATPAPRRKASWWVGGLVAVAAIGAGGFVLFGRGGNRGGGSTPPTDPAPVAAAAVDAGLAPVAASAIDAGLAPVAAAVIDAGVPDDAATVLAVEAIDAGETDRRGKRRGNRRGDHGTSSGSGIVDRGD